MTHTSSASMHDVSGYVGPSLLIIRGNQRYLAVSDNNIPLVSVVVSPPPSHKIVKAIADLLSVNHRDCPLW